MLQRLPIWALQLRRASTMPEQIAPQGSTGPRATGLISSEEDACRFHLVPINRY